MSTKLNKNKVGLSLGLLFGLLHLVWAILVALGLANRLLNFILGLHFVNLSLAIKDFNAGTALALIVATFIVGYVAGWILASIWNRVHKK